MGHVEMTDFYLGILCAATAALALLVTLALTAAAWLWRKVANWSHVDGERSPDGAVNFTVSIRSEPVRDGWLRRLWGWATRQGQL